MIKYLIEMKKFVFSLAFIGFGALAMAQQTQPMPPMRDVQDQKEMVQQQQAKHLAQMEKNLNLSKAQVEQIKAIQQRHLAQRMENQKLRQQQMQNNREQMENDMKKILTPEQFAKWQSNRQQYRQNSKMKMMQNRKAKFGKDCPANCPMHGQQGDFKNKMQQPMQK